MWSGQHERLLPTFTYSPLSKAVLGRSLLGLDIQTLLQARALPPQPPGCGSPRAQNLSPVIAFRNVFAPNQFHASVRTPPCTGGADLPTTNLPACITCAHTIGTHLTRYTRFRYLDAPTYMNLRVCILDFKTLVYNPPAQPLHPQLSPLQRPARSPLDRSPGGGPLPSARLLD